MSKCSTQDMIEMMRTLRNVESDENYQRVKAVFSNVEETEKRLDAKITEWENNNPFYEEISDEDWVKMYGDETERASLADKLWTILGDNPHIAELIEQDMIYDLARPKANYPIGMVEWADNGKDIKLNYGKVPKATLKKWILKASGWAQAKGEQFNSGFYKKTSLAHGLPQNIKYDDPTAGYAIMAEAKDTHADGIGYSISQYMHDDGKRGYGMQDIYDDLAKLFENISEEGRRNWGAKNNIQSDNTGTPIRKWITELFTMAMHGQAVFVSESMAAEKNQFNEAGTYIFTQRAPTGKQFENGDAVFHWQKPIKLEDYNPEIHGTPGNKLVFKDAKGRERHDLMEFFKLHVPLNEHRMAKFQEILVKARIIDDEVVKKIISITKSSFNFMIRETQNWFPSLDSTLIYNMFTLDEEVETIQEFLDRSITSEELRNNTLNTYNYLQNNFTKYSLSEPFLFNGDVLQYKENHWPALFDAFYAVMLKNSISELESEIDRIRIAKNQAKGAEKITFRKTLEGLKSSHKKSMETFTRLIEDDNVDNVGRQITTRKTSKYAKHISNAFDMLNMRKDGDVYRDYLTQVMTTPAVNNLNGKLMIALRTAKDYAGVQEAIIGLYKRILGHKDARSQVFGFETADENWSPAALANMRAFNNWTTMKLGGLASPITNLAGHIQKMIHGGSEAMWEAINQTKDLKNNEVFKRLIADSGVVEFEEFYGASIIEDLEALSIKKDGINKLMAATLGYWKEVGEGGNRRTAEAKLKKFFLETFKQEMNFDAIYSPEEAKKMSKKMKLDKRIRITSKLVNWAITREFSQSQEIKDLPWNTINLGKKGTTYIFDKLANVMSLGGIIPTMSETEKTLRMSSVVMAYNSLKKMNLVVNPIDELTSAERNLVIKWGRIYTRQFLDFGMSSSDAGEVFGSAIGKLMSKFSIWKQQKYIKDSTMFTDAMKTVRDDDALSSVIQSWFKVWYEGIKIPTPKRQKLARTAEIDIAMVRSFLWSQGIMQGLLDLAMITAELTGFGLFRIGVVGLMGAAGIRKGNPLGSSYIALRLLPLVILMQMMAGNLDDEDDLFKIIKYYIRHIPMTGLGSTLISELALALSFGDEKIATEALKDATKTMLPVSQGVATPLVDAAGKLILPDKKKKKKSKYR
tara:strand:+ start:1180 stop:4614 length:3435 start_codon:yes stop_codon:yes gene_type:complete